MNHQQIKVGDKVVAKVGMEGTRGDRFCVDAGRSYTVSNIRPVSGAIEFAEKSSDAHKVEGRVTAHAPHRFDPVPDFSVGDRIQLKDAAYATVGISVGPVYTVERIDGKGYLHFDDNDGHPRQRNPGAYVKAKPVRFVHLYSESSGWLYTRHADLAAAVQWLQDMGITGSFRAIHCTEGETLTASREVKTVVKVNE